MFYAEIKRMKILNPKFEILNKFQIKNSKSKIVCSLDFEFKYLILFRV
jgi:hypothetical protein